MDGNRSRFGMLIGVAAAAGAFGAAAMMSAATAPTARADDYTEILNAVEADFTGGQTAFGDAATDFGGGDVTDGLAAYLQGVDDDFVAAPDNVLLGTVEALSNEPISLFSTLTVTAPTDFAAAVSDAENLIGVGQTALSDAAAAFAAGDYVDAVAYDLDASLYGVTFSSDELLLGAVEALGL
jgi:hypothetical protein